VRCVASLLLLLACGPNERATRPLPREPATPVALPDEAPAQERAERAKPQAPEMASSPAERILALDGSASTSLGGPNDGSLRGGVPLPLTGPGFRFNPRRDRAARFGTVELVQALVRAASVVDRELGGEVTINDLGYRSGGAIPHHGSHRAGRDVDVLFYLLDGDGDPHPGVGAPLDPDGRGTDYRDLADPDDDVPVRIDLRRTWRFLQALLEGTPDDGPALQRIFLVEHLRTLLLEEAARQRAPEAAVRRFADLTCQPSYPHDDHFHFRFYCSREDMGAGCEESPPIYPWRREALREHGLTPTINRPRADRPQAPITTAAQARAAVGPMHPSVRRFLRRRRAWMTKPHPGRRWCR